MSWGLCVCASINQIADTRNNVGGAQTLEDLSTSGKKKEQEKKSVSFAGASDWAFYGSSSDSALQVDCF